MFDSDSRKRKYDSMEDWPFMKKSDVIFKVTIPLFSIDLGADGRPKITFGDFRIVDTDSPAKRARIEEISEPVVASSDGGKAVPQVNTMSATNEAVRIKEDQGVPQVDTISAPNESDGSKEDQGVLHWDSFPASSESDGRQEESAHLDGEECHICYEPFGKVEDVKCLPCDHYFHKACVEEWLMIDETCPVCRRNVTTDRSS